MKNQIGVFNRNLIPTHTSVICIVVDTLDEVEESRYHTQTTSPLKMYAILTKFSFFLFPFFSFLNKELH